MNDDCPLCGERFTYQGFNGGECPTPGCRNYKASVMEPKVKVVYDKIVESVGKLMSNFTFSPSPTYDDTHPPWDQKYEFQMKGAPGLLWSTNSTDPSSSKYWTNPSNAPLSDVEKKDIYNNMLAKAVIGPPRGQPFVTQATLEKMGMVGIYYKSKADKDAAYDWFMDWMKRKYPSAHKP